MKFVTYEENGRALAGVLVESDTRILPLEGFGSVQQLIEAGDEGLERARGLVAGAQGATTLPYDSTPLLAPLPQPVQIRDVLCFLEHMRNAGRVATEMTGGDPAAYEIPAAFVDTPLYYKANRMAVVGHGADVVRPAGCNMLDYELELGIVIGRRGRDISPDKALDHVFGFTVFNDVSARDLQVREMTGGLGPAKGKDFDTGNVLGPCIVTTDEVDPHDMTMIARLNGEEISRGSTSQMDHTIEDAVAYVSRGETIHPGEIVGSGTVPLGCLLEHKRALADGDVVELEIEGIGVLRNQIVGART
ncbi:MAG: fumarylacetoacetate hydrolase family protein [Myxococcota bacterium]|nr:fumarylacetoacetate hydrolase family protein [Myxococcota bacterium]